MHATDCKQWAQENKEQLSKAAIVVAATITIMVAGKILNKLFG